jgi:hypothetical protein
MTFSTPLHCLQHSWPPTACLCKAGLKLRPLARQRCMRHRHMHRLWRTWHWHPHALGRHDNVLWDDGHFAVTVGWWLGATELLVGGLARACKSCVASSMPRLRGKHCSTKSTNCIKFAPLRFCVRTVRPVRRRVCVRTAVQQDCEPFAHFPAEGLDAQFCCVLDDRVRAHSL